MSSDSDDFSVSSAVKTRRYRQRQRAGIIARPMATPDEQHRLLSLPFDTLTPKQKARVRYYRRRDRNQQQHQQSLQLEQQLTITPITTTIRCIYSTTSTISCFSNSHINTHT